MRIGPGARRAATTRAAASPWARRARLAGALPLAAAAALHGAALLPIPPVDASAMEPAVRQQVEAARQSLADREPPTEGTAGRPPSPADEKSGSPTRGRGARPPMPAPEAAGKFGEAGQIFLLYTLLDAALPCFENAVTLAPEDFRWAYYAGVAAQQHDDLDRAADHFRRAVALHSPFPAALIRLGEVEILRGDVASAGHALTAALAVPGTAPAAHFALGRVALQLGDARAAVEHFEAVLAAQPEASIVHAPLAAAYRRLGQLDKAQAQAAAYGDRPLMPVRFPDPLMRQMAAANARNKSRFADATRALKENRFAAAAEGFRQVLLVDAEDVAAWLNFGVAQERMGDAIAAEQSYRRAVAIDPESPRAHYNLGTLLAAHGARREAIEQLETAVRLRPDSLDARFNLATALAEEGRLADALGQCDALLRLAPQNEEARALRDQLRSHPSDKKPPPPP